MEKKLPETRGLVEVNKGTAWPIIGGIAGALIGLMILQTPSAHIFVLFNTTLIGGAIGVFYSRIGILWAKSAEAITITGIVGGFFGSLSGLTDGGFLFAFIFTVPYLWLLVTVYKKYWDKDLVIWLCLLVPGISALIAMILARHVAPTEIGLGNVIFFVIISFIPFLNFLSLLAIFTAGSAIGSILISRAFIINSLNIPYFALPLLSFAGYFIGCKIGEGKKPKEYIREIPKGGFIMAEDPAFLKETSGGISPVAFSEKAMIQDLLSALNNKSLLLTKLESWKARAKGQDQLKAFGMIREMLETETDIVKAYIDNQQAKLDFKNLREFNQHIQKEKLKAQLAEEQYRQAELEEKLKSMKLEEEYKRLELQRKIEGLKKARETTESKIERIKKEQLEKIDFQEEIKKMKTIKLADRVEYIHDQEKKFREKLPSEEAEKVIEEFRRMLFESSLMEE